jgi:hypothetical protein
MLDHQVCQIVATVLKRIFYIADLVEKRFIAGRVEQSVESGLKREKHEYPTKFHQRLF